MIVRLRFWHDFITWCACIVVDLSKLQLWSTSFLSKAAFVGISFAVAATNWRKLEAALFTATTARLPRFVQLAGFRFHALYARARICNHEKLQTLQIIEPPLTYMYSKCMQMGFSGQQFRISSLTTPLEKFNSKCEYPLDSFLFFENVEYILENFLYY